MRRCWTVSIVAVVAILGLSACAEFSFHRSKATTQPPSSNLGGLAVVVNGAPIGELLADPVELRKVLTDLELDDLALVDDRGKLSEVGRKNVQDLLDRIKSRGNDPKDKGETEYLRATDDVRRSLLGVGGFSVVQLLEALLASGVERQVFLSGGIKDYIFDKDTKSGHLAVDTRIKIYETSESFIKGVPDRVERYHWDIEVEGIYEVQEHSGNDLDPFPGTAQYPDGVEFTKYTLREIKRRGLKYKLFAKGEKIKVRNVYEIFEDGSVTLLPKEHIFYTSTEESCIDIMFDRFPPAVDLPPQRGYCLGRCDHPQVVNTGS